MTKLKTGAQVVVADGEKALVLRNDGDAQDPDPNVERIEAQDNPPTRDQAANRGGRARQSANHGGSAQDDTDWHEFEKERFAKDVAGILFKKAHQGAFDDQVVVAGPQILGVLRDACHRKVADPIVAEIPTKLTGHPNDQIEKMVKAELA